MLSPRVGGWAESSESSERVSPGRQRRYRAARESKGGIRKPGRRRYLELHFLIHLQQRGHGRAGPSAPLETGDAVGSGEGGQRDGRNLGFSGDAAALVGSLTARLLPPSVQSVRPPACCRLPAGSLRSPSRLSPLTPELTSQPIAGASERMCTCPAQLCWGLALHAPR